MAESLEDRNFELYCNGVRFAALQLDTCLPHNLAKETMVITGGEGGGK
jgi:hypothetical protein